MAARRSLIESRMVGPHGKDRLEGVPSFPASEQAAQHSVGNGSEKGDAVGSLGCSALTPEGEAKVHIRPGAAITRVFVTSGEAEVAAHFCSQDEKLLRLSPSQLSVLRLKQAALPALRYEQSRALGRLHLPHSISLDLEDCSSLLVLAGQPLP